MHINYLRTLSLFLFACIAASAFSQKSDSILSALTNSIAPLLPIEGNDSAFASSEIGGFLPMLKRLDPPLDSIKSRMLKASAVSRKADSIKFIPIRIKYSYQSKIAYRVYMNESDMLIRYAYLKDCKKKIIFHIRGKKGKGISKVSRNPERKFLFFKRRRQSAKQPAVKIRERKRAQIVKISQKPERKFLFFKRRQSTKRPAAVDTIKRGADALARWGEKGDYYAKEENNKMKEWGEKGDSYAKEENNKTKEWGEKGNYYTKKENNKIKEWGEKGYAAFYTMEKDAYPPPDKDCVWGELFLPYAFIDSIRSVKFGEGYHIFYTDLKMRPDRVKLFLGLSHINLIAKIIKDRRNISDKKVDSSFAMVYKDPWKKRKAIILKRLAAADKKSNPTKKGILKFLNKKEQVGSSRRKEKAKTKKETAVSPKRSPIDRSKKAKPKQPPPSK